MSRFDALLNSKRLFFIFCCLFYFMPFGLQECIRCIHIILSLSSCAELYPTVGKETALFLCYIDSINACLINGIKPVHRCLLLVHGVVTVCDNIPRLPAIESCIITRLLYGWALYCIAVQLISNPLGLQKVLWDLKAL